MDSWAGALLSAFLAPSFDVGGMDARAMCFMGIEDGSDLCLKWSCYQAAWLSMLFFP